MHQRLGQHFLVNPKAARAIVQALELAPDETVIEIGPGMGTLIDELENWNYGLRIIGIEKDKRLARFLQTRYAKNANIEIISGDALKILPAIIHDSKFMIQGWKLVGNIPYYITGQLLRILGGLESKPAIAVLMLQKEVAERVSAKPPEMNLLSAMTQFWAEPKILLRLRQQDFKPAPEVESAIIKLEIKKQISPPKADQPLAENIKNKEYFSFVKILFKQPRKTVFNNLKPGFGNIEKIKKILARYGLTGSERPQNLTLPLLIKLSEEFHE